MDVESQASKRQQRLRVYEQWQGNERFFCWGHCVAGPNWKSGLGSVGLLLAPTVVFLALVVPYMSVNVSWAILVISILFPCFCVSMLLLTACRDPGILPRQEPDADWLANRKPRTRDVVVNGHTLQVRYNDTCHFYQPPRAHHCSVNDNCIERFDHHCPWVGTTVGLRNYRTFLLFIYSTTLYIMWTFGVSLGMLFVKQRELAAANPQLDNGRVWLNTLGQVPAAIALIVFTFIFFWFVGGLSGFHTYLVATNQTTYENFRYNHSHMANPYSLGLFGNCATVWCIKVPPSRVEFRAWADEWRPAPIEVDYNPHWPRSAHRATPVAAPTDARAFDSAQAAAAAPAPLPGRAPNVPGGARRVGNRAAVAALQHHQSQQQQQQRQEGARQGPLTANRSRLGHSELLGGSMAPPEAGDSAGSTPALSTWGSATREDRLTLENTPWQDAAAPPGATRAAGAVAGAPLDARRHPPPPPVAAAAPPPGPPQLYAPMSPGAAGGSGHTSSGGGVARLQDIELTEGHA